MFAGYFGPISRTTPFVGCSYAKPISQSAQINPGTQNPGAADYHSSFTISSHQGKNIF